MEQNEIYRTYGTDYKEMTKRLLKAADLEEELRRKLAGKEAPCIAIKPNLVSPTPAQFGATTHPEVVAGIIESLQELGYFNLMIVEGSWVGDKTEDAFEYCGYHALAQQYGILLFDTQKDTSCMVTGGGLSLYICSILKQIDFLINVPVLKGHCQTKVTCALKNLKGLIPNAEKRRFHSLGLHTPIACLNTAIRPDLIVVDHICGDPDFEDGGNPLVRNCILAAKDPVLTDAFACRELGYQPDEVEYIKIARELGAGNADLTQLQLHTIGEDIQSRDRSVPLQDSFPESPEAAHSLSGSDRYESGSAAMPEKAALAHRMLELNYATEEIDSCSACYSALCGALDRLEKEGRLELLTKKLQLKFCIGQGYRGISSNEENRIGIGTCTRGFQKNIPGCPPTEDMVYEFLISTFY